MEYQNVDGGEIGAKISELFKPQREQVAASVAERSKPAAEKPGGDAAASADAGKAKLVKATVIKSQIERGVISVIASRADIFDNEGDAVERDTLIDMAHDFTAKADRTILRNHDGTSPLSKAELVGSSVGPIVLKSGRILKDGEKVTDEDPMVAVLARDAAKGESLGWQTDIRLNDPDLVKAIKEGDEVCLGASWAGSAHRESIAA